MFPAQSQEEEELSPYDVTNPRGGDTNPDHDNHYEILKHDKGPLVAPAKPKPSAYDSVVLTAHGNSSVPPDMTTYDVAFQNSNTDDSTGQQPVSNPVYSLGGLSNNPMYGTSADIEEVKQLIENEQAQNNTFKAVNGQQENNEIENSDEVTPPIPPQNF